RLGVDGLERDRAGRGGRGGDREGEAGGGDRDLDHLSAAAAGGGGGGSARRTAAAAGGHQHDRDCQHRGDPCSSHVSSLSIVGSSSARRRGPVHHTSIRKHSVCSAPPENPSGSL